MPAFAEKGVSTASMRPPQTLFSPRSRCSFREWDRPGDDAVGGLVCGDGGSSCPTSSTSGQAGPSQSLMAAGLFLHLI